MPAVPGPASAPSTAGGGWDRRRLLAILAAVAATAAALLAGLGYAVYLAVTPARQPPGEPAPATAAGHPARGGDQAGDGPARGQAHRDRVAAAPMLEVDPADARPAAPAAVAAPAIQIPAATAVGPAGVPTGFPRTRQGALGQLAAIESAVLQAMSISYTGEVYRAWALTGGTGIADWEMTRNVQAFLAAAEMGPEKDVAATVTATPAAAQVKGIDGPGWVLACVLLEVQATITTDAAIGYGHCEPMQWHAGRWMIAAGAPAARAPSTWPGSQASLDAGWRTWVDAGQG